MPKAGMAGPEWETMPRSDPSKDYCSPTAQVDTQWRQRAGPKEDGVSSPGMGAGETKLSGSWDCQPSGDWSETQDVEAGRKGGEEKTCAKGTTSNESFQQFNELVLLSL